MDKSTTSPASPANSRQDPPKWAKALVGIGVAVAVLWGFGACMNGMRDGAGDATVGVKQTTPTNAPADLASPENVFQLALANCGIPVRDRAVAADAGRAICRALGAGASPATLAISSRRSFNEAAGSDALSLGDASYMVGASVSAFCPQHRNLIG